TKISINLPAIPVIDNLAVCGNLLIAKCANGLWASADNGINFWQISLALPYQGSYTNAIEVIGPDIFVGLSNFGVYWTQNNGNSWFFLNDNLPEDYPVYRMAHDDDY